MGDNEGPTAVMFARYMLRKSNVFYDSDVKTGNIENKINQAIEFSDIVLLFLYINLSQLIILLI